MRRFFSTRSRCARALLIGGILAACAWADGMGITHVQVANFGLDGGAVAGNVVDGAATSTTEYAISGSSFATDGSYKETWAGYASSAPRDAESAVSESITCLISSCGGYAVPVLSGEGTPLAPGPDASAWWNEVITVVPGGDVSALRMTFTVDGTIVTSGNVIAAASLIGETCGIANSFCHAPGGEDPETDRIIFQAPNSNLTSSGAATVMFNMNVPVFNQPFEFEYILETEISDNLTSDGNLTGTSSGAVDFSSTARLISIEPLDANGNIVHDGTVIYDLSGNSLPGVTAVPEPSAFFGLGIGLLLVAMRKRLVDYPAKF